MTTSIRRPCVRRKGSVAIKCAIVLPMLVFLISGLLFFARVFWCYTAAEKAAHNAARFLATATLHEIKPALTGSDIPIALVAQQIAKDEVADLNRGGGIGIEVLCYVGAQAAYWGHCFGFDVPANVLVRVTIPVMDPFFDPFTSLYQRGNNHSQGFHGSRLYGKLT